MKIFVLTNLILSLYRLLFSPYRPKGVIMFLEPILGSQSKEQVLQYILAFGEGYATEIAHFFDTQKTPILKQLNALEEKGVFISKSVGRTVVYSFNPRYKFFNELSALLIKARSYYSENIQERLIMSRKRPRRRGKPL